MRKILNDMSLSELEEYFEGLGEKKYRAKQGLTEIRLHEKVQLNQHCLGNGQAG